MNDGTPDRTRALAHYRRAAAGYDASARRIECKRLRAVELLELRPGETVLDVACGTGSLFAALAAKVGASGLVIGVDQSPEMLALARQRLRAAACGNIHLVEAPIEEARLPAAVDAIVFSYAHDVLRSPKAIANVFAFARPRARVVSCGVKLYPRWLALLNFWLRRRTYGYLSTTEGLDEPWSLLAAYCPDFAVQETFFWGSGYIGKGTYRGPAG